MPRPKIPRRVCGKPCSCSFKPSGISLAQLERVNLAADEFEAVRLVDFHGMQQQVAAKHMVVSRQTLANILKSGRYKLVECLLDGKALFIDN
ncbi:DUF134 domain-containing protein [Reinekea marinisedimentorum]|uniref:UPF0251 protein BCF53_11164 n=1 Tax=Reinekea marinisedimentorum TaxID=230495 RepID=A0A4R3I4G2_9GAMM|nr:DUF134 domain-containing protein [Reinekea marinisedimentorum]TCS39973.1 putative DNA-binding protein (UPF0251 family) [Reinekea marinisedimentorum]